MKQDIFGGMNDGVEIMDPNTQAARDVPSPPNSFNHATQLQLTGIAATFLGTAAVLVAIMLSDASVLLLGMSTLAIGETCIIWGWARLTRLARTFPQVVQMFPPVAESQLSPLGRQSRAVLASVLMLIGLSVLSAGLYLIVSVQQFGVPVTLLGAVLLITGLQGIKSLVRDKQK